MKKIVLFGAGLVTPPLIEYLLQHGFELTVASDVPDQAAALIGGHPNGRSVPIDATDAKMLSELVAAHDLAISLLPAPFHPSVASACLSCRVPMVTSSYVSDEMLAMDAPARDAGVILLNEVGVDPGIDHMSAMRIVDDVRARGGRITSFKSYCGGLPAPDANDNPWGYKFSWSPRGVCTAGKAASRWLQDGQEINVPGELLFANAHPVPIDSLGMFEGYPNRDSIKYIDIYGLKHVRTMLRGTLRYPGWCDCLKGVVDLGLLSEEPVTYPPGLSLSGWTRTFLADGNAQDVRTGVADQLGLEPGSDALDRFEWLGLFSDAPCPITGEPTTALDVLAARMAETMPYGPNERDMIVMHHAFTAEMPGGQTEEITSTLVDYGQPGGHSSMARTVGLPAATAARLILEGTITETGVHIPVAPNIYNPILTELETLGIAFTERTEAGV